MNKYIHIRTNGRGNAWPLLLGSNNLFYDNSDTKDYANASFSLTLTNGDSLHSEAIMWDLLIDAGHGVIQYYLENCNRIPEAIVFTHPHHDHTFSLDWFVQSYTRTHPGKTFTVYATQMCWKFIIRVYPQLQHLITFRELVYGVETSIDQCSGLSITAYPVFHGESASGAAMLQCKYEDKSFLFSGDILTPLLREKDYEAIKHSEILYTDANNKFAYPLSNHWSITSEETKYLDTWEMKDNLAHFISTHMYSKATAENHRYINTFLHEQVRKSNLYYSIFDFTKAIVPEKVKLVHYGGAEDITYHNENANDAANVSEWLKVQQVKEQVPGEISFPEVGDVETWQV